MSFFVYGCLQRNARLLVAAVVLALGAIYLLSDATLSDPARRLSSFRPSILDANGRSNLSEDGLDPLLDSIRNSTLGFQHIFVVSVASRTDRRDSLALAAANTGLHLTFLDGVRADDILEKALPPHKAGIVDEINPGALGAWRALSNALRHVVENNITSALIMEGDADWDVRIKDQMRDFARATRALTQPLAGSTEPGRLRYADPTYPRPASATDRPDPMYADALPATLPPSTSPYGDAWDVLLPGHCGVFSPLHNLPAGPEWAARAALTPKGHVVAPHDPTVPAPQHIHSWDDAGVPPLRAPDRARTTHHALGFTCSNAFAVSAAGARRLLHYQALRALDGPFDIGLARFCGDDVALAERGGRGACITTQPMLFSQYRLPGAAAKGSEIGGGGGGGEDVVEGWTQSIRVSAQVNAENIAYGLELKDQYPD